MAQEICNRVSKDVVRGMGTNKTAKAMTRASKVAARIQQIVRRVNDESDIKRVSQVHSQKSSIEVELMMVKDLRRIKPFERKLGRSHAHFDQMQVSPTNTIGMKSLFLWLEKHRK
jgi:Holliday junction resolvasome RuvABC ATP-dependent DNA helicase subunit